MTTFFDNFDNHQEDKSYYVNVDPYLAPRPPVIPESARNDTKFYEKIYWSFTYQNVSLLIAVIIFIAAVICINILIIFGILYSKRKLLSDYYIVNLAVADILVGILVLPFMCIVVLLGYFPFGHTTCSFWIFFDYYLIIASAFGYAELMVCYFWMINWPDNYKTKARKTHISIIVTLWVLINVAWGPPFFQDRAQTDQDGTGVCGYNINLNGYFTLYFGIIGLYIPAMISTVAALWAGIVLFKHNRSSRIFFGDIVPDGHRPAPMFLIKALPSDKQEVPDYMEIASAHLPLIICMLCTFLASRCLFYIYFGAGAFIPHFFPPDLSNGVYWVMHSNAALNPILHILFDRQLRQGIGKFLCSKRNTVHNNEIVL